MPQQHTRPHGRDDEESEQSRHSYTSRDDDSDSDSGYGSDHHDDDLIDEINRLIQEAPKWETFVQKGGQ